MHTPNRNSHFLNGGLRHLAWLAMGVAAFIAVPPGGAQEEPPAGAGAPVGGDEYFLRTVERIGDTRLPSVRSRGMGGVWTALANDGASIHENPAALGAMSGSSFEALLGLQSVDNGEDSKTETVYRAGGAVALANGLGAHQTVGLAFARRDLAEAYSTGGMKQDAFTLAYGSNYGSDILWGVALSGYNGEHGYHFNSDQRDRTTWTGGELSGGILYRMGDDFTLGGTAGLGGGTVRSQRQDEAGEAARQSGDLQRYFLRAGMAWQLAPATLLAGDIGWSKNALKFNKKGDAAARDMSVMSWDVGLGVEHALIYERLVARAGVNYHRASFKPGGDAAEQRIASKLTDDYFSFTAGLGARLGSAVDVGYTLDVRTNGDIGNYFGAQIGF